MAERQGANSQGVELVRGTAAEDSTPALSPEAETSPRAAPVGDPEFTRILNHTAYLGDVHCHSPPPAPVKPRVAFQTPSTASKVSSLFRQMTLDHIFDNESREVSDIEPTHKRKRSDIEVKPAKASVVRNLGPSWQLKEI